MDRNSKSVIYSLFIVLGFMLFSPQLLSALSIGITPSLYDPCTFQHPIPVGCISTPPAADFLWELKNRKVLFEDTSTDFDGDIIAHFWYFGDGEVSTKQYPQHQYKETGTYMVTLVVLDNTQIVGSTSQAIHIPKN